MPTKPDVGIRNVATQRWATSWVQIRPTTAHAVLRCFAASTCWNGGKGQLEDTHCRRLAAVASAKVTGKIQTNTQRFGETSNQWIRCPNCQETGYHSDSRPSTPARPAQRAAPPRVGPTVADVLRNTEWQPRPQPSTPEEPEQQEPEQQSPPPSQAEQPSGRRSPHPDEQQEPVSSPLSRVRKNNQGRRPRIPTNNKRQ